MSFGGSVSAMISSLKNNARPKRKTYFDRNDSKKKKSDYRHPALDIKASAAHLEQIRKEIKNERRRNRLIQLLYFSLAVVLIISLTWIFGK